jgi:hypothetical protein
VLEALSTGWLTRGARKSPHRRLETANGKENKIVSARLVFGGELEQDRDSFTVFEVATKVQERDQRSPRSLSGGFRSPFLPLKAAYRVCVIGIESVKALLDPALPTEPVCRCRDTKSQEGGSNQ